MQFGIATTILHSVNTQLVYIILLLFIRAFRDNSTGKDLPITFIIFAESTEESKSAAARYIFLNSYTSTLIAIESERIFTFVEAGEKHVCPCLISSELLHQGHAAFKDLL